MFISPLTLGQIKIDSSMNSLFDVSGKVAVVTGGSGVLGSNISEGLLKAGAKVAVIGAHSDRVEKALERLRTTGGEVCGFTCNSTWTVCGK